MRVWFASFLGGFLLAGVLGCVSQPHLTKTAKDVSNPSETLDAAQLKDWMKDFGDWKSSVDVSLDLRTIAFSPDKKNIYVGGNFYLPNGVLITAVIFRSTDAGKSWQRLAPVHAQHSINQLQVLANGEVLAFTVLESEGSLFEGVLASPDQGNTWTYHGWSRTEAVHDAIRKIISCCTENLIYAQFKNRENGTVVLQGDEKTVRLQTDDGGQSFALSPDQSFQATPRPEYLFKVSDSKAKTAGHFVEIWKVDKKNHPKKLFAKLSEKWAFLPETLEFQPVK